MLDDFGNELETTESKLDTTMKKVAKVLHMNNGKCQVCFVLYKCMLPEGKYKAKSLFLMV